MVVLPPSPSVPDTAVAFYFRHYAMYGRDIAYARGFFEVLVPVYRSQKHDSALSHAVNALASLVLAIWRDGSHGADSQQPPLNSYVQAIASVRRALVDHQQVTKPATLLAILALQFYENIIAVFNFRLARHTHQDGAISLLSSAEPEETNAMIIAYVKKFILHVEISSALRRKRPIRTIIDSCLMSKVVLATPYNPSIALDDIVVSIVELQNTRLQVTRQRLLGQEDDWRTRAKKIDGQLLTWARSIPLHWKPTPLLSGHDFDPAIPSYLRICDNYLSCQIANVWNLWRLQRLTLVNLMLTTIDSTSHNEVSWPVRGSSLDGCEDLAHYKEVVQELVDSVCRSIPFYLSNRNRPSSMADFTDPDIVLLGQLRLDSRLSINYKQDHAFSMPSDEHRRHIIAQGPWHIMSPLSRLVTLLSEDPILASLLRPGQHQWIQAQFLRVMKLLHIFPAKHDNSGEFTADLLAKQVRKGALFMSGP